MFYVALEYGFSFMSHFFEEECMDRVQLNSPIPKYAKCIFKLNNDA